MNTRERFLAIMRFEPCDRALLWEFGYWGGAVLRWYEEGLPRVYGLPHAVQHGETVRGPGQDSMVGGLECSDRDIAAFLGFDAGSVRVPVYEGIHPQFVPEVLEEDDRTRVIRDERGSVKRVYKDGSSMPQFLKRPVAGRADWEAMKERLQPTLAERLPVSWPQLLEEYSQRDYPLCIGGYPYGFYGTVRELMGFEGISLALHEDRELVRDMMSYLAGFWVDLYDQFLSAYNGRLHVDCAYIWEDMCYKAGPLIAPAMFEELMLPCYRKLTGLFRDHGIEIILVDTDGNCSKLIGLFLQGGVTGLYPFEVAAGMDVVAVREAYPKLQMLGGIDKRALAAGNGAIDAELERRVLPILERGGYIPYVDHSVPPDVSWQSFVHYRRRLHAMLCQPLATR